MTKHEKKVLEAINAIIKNRKQVKDLTERGELILSSEISAYSVCICLLTDEDYLNDILRIYKDF